MRSIARRTLLLAAGAALALAGCTSNKAASDLTADHSVGLATAPVTVIEYASPTCPHCGAWEAEVWPQFKAKYLDSGKVRYVLREAPIHGAADVAAFMLARCAPGDKYFDVIQAVMRAQPDYLESLLGRNDTGPYRTSLMNVAQSMGMSEQKASDCINDPKSADAFKTRTDKEMKEFSIEGTPTFVVNGTKMDATHPPSMAELGAAIDPLLAKK